MQALRIHPFKTGILDAGGRSTMLAGFLGRHYARLHCGTGATQPAWNPSMKISR